MRALLLALVLAAGCSSPPAPASQHLPLAGDACDPEGDPGQCGPDLVCTSLGVCDGPACGNGNVVCGGTTVCTAAADCIPPCLVAGAAVYRPGTGCEARGLITAADGRCVVPCWYELCDVLGGSCS